MDALRDHLRNDLRHDLVGHRVRCNVNRRDHHVMFGHHVNRRSDLQDVDHRLLLDDRHRMGYLCVDDLKLDVSSDVNRGLRMNDLLDDQSLVDDHRDVPVGHRMNVTDDRNDLKMDETTDGNLCHRMSDPLDDRNLDDDRHDVLGDLRKNVMDDRNDLMMVVNLLNRNCALHDPKMVVNLDVSRVNRRTGVHLNAQLVYEHRVDLTIDPECYVRRDLKMVVN